MGNTNRANGKRWQAALERALERRARGQPRPTDVSDLIRGLDEAADLFLESLLDGKDLGFFKEFADRIDGKPKQQIEATGEDGGPLRTALTVEYIRPPT